MTNANLPTWSHSFYEVKYLAIEILIKWQTMRSNIVLINIQAMKNYNKLAHTKKRCREYGMAKLIIKHRYSNHKKMNQRKREEKKPCLEAWRRINAVMCARRSIFCFSKLPLTCHWGPTKPLPCTPYWARTKQKV